MLLRDRRDVWGRLATRTTMSGTPSRSQRCRLTSWLPAVAAGRCSFIGGSDSEASTSRDGPLTLRRDSRDVWGRFATRTTLPGTPSRSQRSLHASCHVEASGAMAHAHRTGARFPPVTVSYGPATIVCIAATIATIGNCVTTIFPPSPPLSTISTITTISTTTTTTSFWLKMALVALYTISMISVQAPKAGPVTFSWDIVWWLSST